MKKLIFTLAMAAGLALAANPAQAQNNQGQNQQNQEKQVNTQNPRSGFVDNNNDGVCDNYTGNRPGQGLGPGNGNGPGRANGKGLGRGRGDGQGRGDGGNFVDNDKNGICDNLENGTGRQRLRDGSGRGTGQGN
mgnify:CR=1 FL=1